MNDEVENFDADSYEEEITFGEILANLALNGELIITIPTEAEPATKAGLKNLKAKQATKLREENLPVPDEILEFFSSPSAEFEDCINLHIVLKKKGVVKVKKITIPDNSL